jgi:hypothetical protein
MKLLKIIKLLIVTLAMNASPVFAEPVGVINVRVNLSNMLADQGRVKCSMRTRGPGQIYTVAEGYSTPFAIRDGRFRSTVRVALDFRDATRTADQIDNYECRLELRQGDAPRWHDMSLGPHYNSRIRRWQRAKRGAPYRAEIRGPVTRVGSGGRVVAPATRAR